MTVIFKEIISEIDELDEAIIQDNNSPKAKAAELFARCRAASTAAHFAHLMESSYAAHVALKDFYEEIVDLADAFAESFTGRFGKFESFPNIKESSTDGLIVVGNLTKFIDTNRALITDNSELQNDIDSILSFCNSIAYKLRELK